MTTDVKHEEFSEMGSDSDLGSQDVMSVYTVSDVPDESDEENSEQTYHAKYKDKGFFYRAGTVHGPGPIQGQGEDVQPILCAPCLGDGQPYNTYKPPRQVCPKGRRKRAHEVDTAFIHLYSKAIANCRRPQHKT